MKNKLLNIITILTSVTLTLNFAENSRAATYVFNQIGFPNGFQVDGTITTDAMGHLTLSDLNQADYFIRVFNNASVNYTLTTANSTWSSLTLGLSELLLTANETELVFDFSTPGDFDFGSLSLTNDSNSSERWEFRQQTDIGSLVETNTTVGFAGGFSTRNLVADSQLLFPTINTSFNFSQEGFPGGGIVTGMFAGVDSDNNGFIDLPEVTSYMMSVKGNSVVQDFIHDLINLDSFNFEVGTKSFASGDLASSDDVHDYDALFGTLSSEIETAEDVIVIEQPGGFFDFSQSGFVGGGIVTGTFSGEDFNNDGFISFLDDEVDFYDMNLQGNSVVQDFIHGLINLDLLEYKLGTRSFASGDLVSSDDLRDYDGGFKLIEVTLEQENLEPAVVTSKVPEPSTTLGIVLGLGMGALLRKRK